MRKTPVPVIAAAMLSLFGCGSDDPPGKGSGVARDKQVSELSREETRKLCLSLAEHMSVLRQAVERAGCITPNLEDDSCEEERDRCLEQAKRMDLTDECESAPEDMTGGKRCKASVGELEECFATVAKEAVEYAEEATCDKGFDDLPVSAVPDVCKDIAAECDTVSAVGAFAGEDGGDGEDGTGDEDDDSQDDDA